MGDTHDLGPIPNLAALAGYGDSYVLPGSEVYVVDQDCDYAYRNTSPNPAADGFNVVKALFLPGVWERRNSSGSSSTGQDVYVSKNGNDVTGNGTPASPFLTIQRALTSITDASATKPYTVRVGQGTFTEVFGMIPWVTIKGSGRLTTTIAPVQANWLAAAFAVAGTLQASIEDCTIGAVFVADFAAITAVGTCSILLQNLFVSSGIDCTITGNAVTHKAYVQNVETLGTTTQSGTNITLNNINSTVNAVDLGTSSLFINGNDLYSTGHQIGSCGMTGLSVISTATASANRLNVNCRPETTISASSIILTGIFAALNSPGRLRRVAPDAATEFGFGNSTVAASVGAVMLINGGDNLIFCNNSADRSYAFGRPPTNGTRVRLKNQSPFNVDFTFLGSAGTTGDSTYIGPFGYIEMWLSDGTWMIDNPIQSGTVQLINGISPVIPADIAAQAVITATLKSFSGAGGKIVAKTADRVIGTHAGGGSFKLTSIDQATGATVATDTGTYDWMVARP
jgi:hypothetical protein